MLNPRANRIQRPRLDARMQHHLNLARVGRLGVGRSRRRPDPRVHMRHRRILLHALADALHHLLGIPQRRAGRQGERFQQYAFIRQGQKIHRHPRQPGQAADQQRHRERQTQARCAQYPLEQTTIQAVERR